MKAIVTVELDIDETNWRQQNIDMKTALHDNLGLCDKNDACQSAATLCLQGATIRNCRIVSAVATQYDKRGK